MNPFLLWFLLVPAMLLAVGAGLYALWRSREAARDQQARDLARRRAAADAARLEAEQRAADEAASLAAAQRAAEAAEAERVEAARREAERAAAEAAEHERRRAAADAARAEVASAVAAGDDAARNEGLHRSAPSAPPRRRLAPHETLVMLADDSKVVRVKTGRLLAQHGYRVVVAESGEEAVAKLDDELPHVLITDVEMPGIDGFELTRRVRADQRTAHIPVVMITSSHDRLQDAARRAGVTLLLGKPYAEQALLDGLRLAQEPAEAAAAT